MKRVPDSRLARAEAGQGDTWRDWLFGWMPFFAPSPPKAAPLTPHQLKAAEAKRKLQDEWRQKVAAVAEKWKKFAEESAELQLKARKTDIRITHFGLAWAPFWQSASGTGTPAYKK